MSPIGSDLQGYPEGALIASGLRDHAEGKVSVGSCLVAIARSGFRARGLLCDADTPGCLFRIAEPEHRLYALLGQVPGTDPYSRYNALLRGLSSFLRAYGPASPERREAAAPLGAGSWKIEDGRPAMRELSVIRGQRAVSSASE